MNPGEKYRIYLSVCIAIILSTNFFGNIVFADPVKDQYCETGNTGKQIPGGYLHLAQSFTPTKNTLTKIEVKLSRSQGITTADGPMVISIRNSLDGEDLRFSGKLLYLVPTSETWMHLEFNDKNNEDENKRPLPVTPGQLYYILIWVSTTDLDGEYLYWHGDLTDPYSGGSAHVSTDHGDSWNDNNDLDFNFKTWGYNEDSPMYSLTINTNGEGTVDLYPSGGSYEPGTVVTLTANANSGWSFNHWSDDLSGSTNPKTITMDEDKTVTAHFIEGENPLTATIDSINPNPAVEEQVVSFSGHGEGGTIIGYNWRSSKDGQLSSQSSFSTSSLSIGTHTIYFKVKNDEDIWSSEDSDTLIIEDDSNDPSSVPEWSVGNYWVYDFNFDFTYSVVDIHGIIKDMKLEVEKIDENNDEYTMKITGNLNAELTLLGIIPGGSYTGYVTGIAHIQKSTLAIKDFTFDCSGSYGVVHTVASVIMTFNPTFDFFDFPIESLEDENNPWNAETFATIDGEFRAGIIYQPFSVEGSFEGEELHFVREEVHNGYNCYLISGNMGPTHGGSSKLWYSPDIGFFADIQETIYGWEDVDATLTMPLKSTNYISDNSPPNKPNTPSGETDIIARKEYTYTSSTDDKDGDHIWYMFDWGDGDCSDWLGSYASGSTASGTHRWFRTGVYNVRVKAKDDTGVESMWSSPLTITVGSGLPSTTIHIYMIEKIDDIDYPYPWDIANILPEWYYRVEATSQDGSVSSDYYYMTHDHTKYGNWLHADGWTPEKDHELLTNSPEVLITIKLMEHDQWFEFGEDLADVSGCNGDGYDNNIDDPDVNPASRGAIYHGTYNLVTDKLKPYSDDPNEFADFVKTENGYLVTRGTHKPDSSTGYDGNDAIVRFNVFDSYDPPIAKIDEPTGNVRYGEETQFMGSVTGGTSSDDSPYEWSWDFGDGKTSDEQNPKHSYSALGKKIISLTITDGFDQSHTDEITINVVENQAPEKPSRPSGKSNCKTDKTYSYTSTTNDPEGDIMWYKFSWGDGSDSGWVGPYDSGEEGSASHKWDKRGSYSIKVKAKDEYNDESEWSDPLSISMPKNKVLTNSLIQRVVGRLIERITALESILQPMINRVSLLEKLFC